MSHIDPAPRWPISRCAPGTSVHYPLSLTLFTEQCSQRKFSKLEGKMMIHFIFAKENVEKNYNRKSQEAGEPRFFSVTPILDPKCVDLPGGPVVQTPCSECRRPGFNLWSRN